MGSVVTVMNMKGGVGKTTVAIHLSGMGSRFKILGKHRKVLLIDYDPQFNLSQAYLPLSTYKAIESTRKTTLAILLDDDAALDPYHLQVPGNNNPPNVSTLVHNNFKGKLGGVLDIVPSTLDLMYVALGQTTQITTPMEERFEKFIREARKTYDLILMDCHPAGSILTKTSLRNSDHVLIPVVPQSYAIRGIGLMIEFINEKKQGRLGPTPHILFNAMPRFGTPHIESTVRADTDLGGLCLMHTLKRYKAFSDPDSGKGFVWSSRKPYSTEAFRNIYGVTEEFLARIGA